MEEEEEEEEDEKEDNDDDEQPTGLIRKNVNYEYFGISLFSCQQ